MIPEAATTSYVPPVPPHADCLREAALALGIDAESAEHFGCTGALVLEGIGLKWQARSEVPGDDWLSIARLPKPASLDATVWRESLLAATGRLMPIGPHCFSIDDTNAGLLIELIPAAHCEDARLVSAHLYGTLCITRAVAVSSRFSDLAHTVPPASHFSQTDSAGVAAPPPPDGVVLLDEALKADLFTPQARELLASAFDLLGGDAASLQSLFERGELRVQGCHINLGEDPVAAVLVAAATLDEAPPGRTPDLHLALASNANLMSLCGLATGRLGGRLALIGRYRMRAASSDHCAQWLKSFTDLAQAIVGQAAVLAH